MPVVVPDRLAIPGRKISQQHRGEEQQGKKQRRARQREAFCDVVLRRGALRLSLGAAALICHCISNYGEITGGKSYALLRQLSACFMVRRIELVERGLLLQSLYQASVVLEIR